MDQLLTSTPEAPWLPPGSVAEVWVGDDCTGFDPAVIVRLAIWRVRHGEVSFFCVPSAKGLDLPTRFLGSGAVRESVEEGIAKLGSDVFGHPPTPERCIGYVRNAVPNPDEGYPHPTPCAHVPVFTVTTEEPSIVEGQWLTIPRARRMLAGRHWWPIVEHAAAGAALRPPA